MPTSRKALLQELVTQRLHEAAKGDDSLEMILHELLRSYEGLDLAVSRNQVPQYIGGYELEQIVNKLGYRKEEKWKRLIDYLCFETKLLDLKFRLIDDDDNQYEIAYEELQSILAGGEYSFGQYKYSPDAIRKHIFPYFTPRKRFYFLLNLEEC